MQWPIFILTVLLVVALAEVLLRRTPLWLFVLRGAWVCGVAYLLMDFQSVTEQKLSEPSPLQIFIDRSDSVTQVPERLQRVQTLLGEVREKAESKNIPLQIFSFADTVQQEQSWEGRSQEEYQTLIAPVTEFLPDSGAQSVIVSDGRWTDQLPARAPATFLSLAAENESDLWVDSYSPVYTAFLKNRLQLKIVIGQRGLDGKNARVRLKKGLELVEEKEVSLQNSLISLEFSYFPEKMGTEFFILEVDPLEGELSSLNNRVGFRINTVRDKIRLLHIGGKPSHDLRTLRGFLTRQPDVDLVSFYILRSIEDDPQARSSELSLIPFPYEELFSTELSNFDVVVLHNFDFNLYFRPFYLVNLAQFVSQGGALLMIGGDQSFHRYRQSPLEPMMPFSYGGPGQFVSKKDGVELPVQHPLTKDLQKAFRSLPWDFAHEVRTHPDAKTLVRFQSGAPLVSLRQVEKGRVLAINSDQMWQMQMNPGVDAGAYGRLMRRVLQYLTFDPELEVQEIEASEWLVGQTVTLKLRSGPPQKWKIQSLLEPERVWEFPAQAQLKFKVPRAGWYQVTSGENGTTVVYETIEKPWLNEWKNLLARKRDNEISFAMRDQIFSDQATGRELLSSRSEPWIRSGGYWSWLILISSLFLFCLDLFFRKQRLWDS
jgi:hypothetical protein